MVRSRTKPRFSDWLASRRDLADPFYYAVVEPSGRTVGLATLMSIRPDMRVVEVGNILYSPALQRTPLATEAQYLIARYAFEALRYRRYEWKCDALNAPSRRAALRFGFTPEGIFRDHMIIKGRSRDTAWFADAGNRMAGAQGRVRTLARAGEFFDRREPEDGARGDDARARCIGVANARVRRGGFARFRSRRKRWSHGRACPGHPRLFLSRTAASKTWMPATSAGMTPRGYLDPIEIRSKAGRR